MPGRFVSQTTLFNFGEANDNLPLREAVILAYGETKSTEKKNEKWKTIFRKIKTGVVCKVFHFPRFRSTDFSLCRVSPCRDQGHRLKACATWKNHAALVAACAAAGSSQRTETSLETPGSCMVTPYSTVAISIVRRLCVTTMNWVPALISETSLVKRPTLASSIGASTSSRMQNGLGW